MSYLDDPKGVPGLDKATISVWFSIPEEAKLAAIADRENRPDVGFELDQNLVGAIPILCWGETVLYELFQVDPNELVYSAYIGPSFIAGFVDNADRLNLAVRWQSQTPAGQTVRGQDGTRYADNYLFGFQDGTVTYSTTPSIDPVLPLSTENWHHVLLSYDLTTGIKGKVWLALDDRNYDGNYFYPCGEVPRALFGDGGGGSDPNGLISSFSLFPDPIGDNDIQFWTDGFEAMSIPFGTPSYSQFGTHVQKVRLAELQIYTGITIDTNDLATRRAFVDDNGFPVPPGKQATHDDPQSGSIEFLGQRPDVLLHGSSDWIAGKNTGPMIDNPDYDPSQPEGPDNPQSIPDPDKQFTPTGEIKSYTPDPSLPGAAPPAYRAGPPRLRKTSRSLRQQRLERTAG